ncbi:MAG: hypothetical protein GXO27_05680 [Chlorobi bacterium]|nr:hypothetical protein [Chlorobiota bacterium]
MKRYFRIAVWFWATIALYGFLLRWHSYRPLPFIKNYAYWLHAHSHAAFLGWLHAAFSLLLAAALFPRTVESRFFKRYYLVMQALVAAMLVSFPLQGYKAWSITFLSLFLVGTYIYAWILFKRAENARRYPATAAFAKTGVVFMLLSSLSPWMLGPVMVFLGKDSIWYHLDVYWYLHFQYNGWFFLAMIALFLYLYERRGLVIPDRVWKQSLLWLFTGIFWGYITNTLWTEPPLYFNFIALLSVFAEAYGLWILWRHLRHRYPLADWSPGERLVFRWVLGAVAVKVGLQFMASCPYFARIAYTVRDMVIGYLHWVMLAVFSTALLLIARRMKVFRVSKVPFGVYFSGMLLMILWIWLRGTLVWMKIPVSDWVHAALVWLTLWTFTGVLMIAWDGRKDR